MPFYLWPAQVRVLWQFLVCRLIIILKARQLGISWLSCIYALWLCVFQAGKVVLIFSKGEREAQEMLRRIKVLYQRLPEWMREALPGLVKDNTTELHWSNGSRCLSLPGTGGRSYTASLVIFDEAAHIGAVRELYMALKPTIDNGGQLIMLSTANGLGNLFHQLWVKAAKKANSFATIFLPWWARPGRDAAWYEAQKGEYTDPEMIHQEYPSNANEAFVSSGRVRFAGKWISKQAENVWEPLGASFVPPALRPLLGTTANLAFFKPREKGRRYVIGADVAEGVEGGDFSTAVVIDRETWEEVASIHGRPEPDEFAGLLTTLHRYYGGGESAGCLLAFERNNHGHTVAAALRRMGVEGVYVHEDKRIGWVTDVKTKPLLVDALAEALRDALCRVRSQEALDEMQVYAIGPDGKTNAPAGYNDDRVMAWGIALAVCRRHVVVDDVW